MLQPFQGSVVSIRRCSQRGRESSGANGVMPKVMPKRSYSVVFGRQGLPTDQGPDYVLPVIVVSVRKAVSCITQMTHGGWKAPSTIPRQAISGISCLRIKRSADKSADNLRCLLKLPDVPRSTQLSSIVINCPRMYAHASACLSPRDHW